MAQRSLHRPAAEPTPARSRAAPAPLSSPFRGRKPIMVFVLAIQMTSGGIIPQIIIYNQLGLLNKYSGLILAYIAMVLPFAIWNMRGFFLNIPKDIFESAAVEGANGRSCGRSPSRWPRPASSRPRCSRSSTPGTTT